MPFQAHPVCRAPDDPNQKIWRYLTLPKFLYILERRSLPFVRLDRMPDRFEGAPSQAAIEVSVEHTPHVDMSREQWVNLARASYNTNQKLFFANCWHQNDRESAAMWAQYSNEGVAIQTTYSRFIKAIAKDPRPIHVGIVEYANNPWQGGLGNTLTHLFRKRLYYEYEQELRAVLYQRPDGASSTEAELLMAAEGANPAVDVAVNLNELLEGLYVSPAKSRWYHELVEDLCRRYKLHILPTPSWLDKAPEYY